MVKAIIEFEIPDLVFDLFRGLYPGYKKEYLEKLIEGHLKWNVKVKILEMPKKKTLTSIEI